MKIIAIKILLILAGLFITSFTPIICKYSHLLLTKALSYIDSSLATIIYTIPAILCGLLWVIGLFGVPMFGIGLIIYGAYYMEIPKQG